MHHVSYSSFGEKDMPTLRISQALLSLNLVLLVLGCGPDNEGPKAQPLSSLIKDGNACKLLTNAEIASLLGSDDFTEELIVTRESNGTVLASRCEYHDRQETSKTFP